MRIGELRHLGSRARRWGAEPSWQEGVRVLAAGLTATLERLERPALMITSARPGEGKTTVCAELGWALAGHGLRVVVADLDLRNPRLHDRLEGTRGPGMTDVVSGAAPLRECLQRPAGDPTGAGGRPQLYLLASGTPIDDPDEVLGRPRAATVLDRLAGSVDVLLVDVPAVLPVADALTTGPAVGAAVLVLDPRRTPAAPLERARDLLTRSGTPVAGVVLNRVRAMDAVAADSPGFSGGGGPA